MAHQRQLHSRDANTINPRIPTQRNNSPLMMNRVRLQLHRSIDIDSNVLGNLFIRVWLQVANVVIKLMVDRCDFVRILRAAHWTSTLCLLTHNTTCSLLWFFLLGYFDWRVIFFQKEQVLGAFELKIIRVGCFPKLQQLLH
jgi:hypothetical protein